MKITNKEILAFVHIEKAAGQTFIKILENSFTFRHCRVAPLKKEHKGIFNAGDMKTVLRINPFLIAVSGHSIKPSSDLKKAFPKIKFITIFRNPLERYVSHYQYWINKLKREISFDKFLEIEQMRNFQTKKIAGSPDVKKAMDILKEEFLLAGTVENFEDFIFVLKRKITAINLDFGYQKRNIAENNEIKYKIKEEYEKYLNIIIRNNRLDIELYEFVKNDLFKKELKTVQIKFGDNKNLNKENYRFKIRREITGKLFRNLYYRPIFELLRYKNGLGIKGSY